MLCYISDLELSTLNTKTRTKNVHKKRSCNNVSNDTSNSKNSNKTYPDELHLIQDFQNCFKNFSSCNFKEVEELVPLTAVGTKNGQNVSVTFLISKTVVRIFVA